MIDFLAKLVQWIRGGSHSGRADERTLTAYCADCGGMTLVQREADKLIYCPQCDKCRRLGVYSS